MKINNLFVVRLWKSSKLLFVFIISFCLLQFFFALKRVQSFPWITWDMYSRKQFTPKEIVQREFYINDTLLNLVALSDWQEEVVKNSYTYYHQMQINSSKPIFTVLFYKYTSKLNKELQLKLYQNLFNTTAEINRYPNWLKKYLSVVTKQKVTKIKVQERVFELIDNQYQPTNKINLIDNF